MAIRSTAPAAPPRNSQRRPRREWAARADRVKRSPDFPVDVEGGRAYLLKGVPPVLWDHFDQATKRHGKSWRWTLLTLMKEFATGTITLKETTQ
jgi:hypothetical protein